MYGYARVIKLSPLASFFTAFVYLFGTVYGGAYYNITSLKTLAWFPGLLFCFERFSTTGKKSFIAGIALVSAFSVLAGYLQVAVYGLLMFVFYVMLRLWVIPDDFRHSFKERFNKNGWVFTGLAAGTILTLPQLVLTYDLAMRSTRGASVEEYAYIGSMFPAALATFFYPMLQGLFRGNSLYLGMIAVWLVPIGFLCREVRQTSFFKVWALFALFSVLLSLGEWSPLYVFLVKATHFYSFRTPAKFLFFICFSLSILAGMGWDRLSRDIQKGIITRAVRRASLLYLTIVVGTLVGIAAIIAIISREEIRVRAWGYTFVQKSFLGKMGHPHSLEEYQQKWDGLIQVVLQTVHPKNPWNSAVLGLMLAGGLIVSIPLWKKKIGPAFLLLLLFFTSADLYLFSWNDLRKDFAYYTSFDHSSLVRKLTQEKTEGRMGRLYGYRSSDELLPLLPSENILYGLEDIGAYSPFVTSRYLETIGLLGNVDDSNGSKNPDLPFLQKHLSLLNFMNVSHILSSRPLDIPGWVLLGKEKKQTTYYLYRNENPHALAHFVSAFEVFKTWKELRQKWMDTGADPAKVIYLEESEVRKISSLALFRVNLEGPLGLASSLAVRQKNGNDEDVWDVTASRPGFFVRSILYEPQWFCKLNGHEVSVLAAHGLFQAVWIPAPGSYRLEFHYHPFLKKAKD